MIRVIIMRWSNLTSREQKLLIVGLIIIMGTAFYIGIYQPQVKTLSSNQQKVKQAMKDLRLKSIMLKKRSTLEERYKKMLAKLNQKEENFLSKNQKPKLIMDLNDLALKTNVNLVSTDPLQMDKDNIYIQFPVRVKLKGTYGNIINFLKEINNLSYLVRVKNLKLSSQLNPTNQLEVELRVASYAIVQRSGDK
ncbi:type IV pilus inner membrane component PilO [Selenihalanaerobacter shriftii]|uniref:Type IV pilus assembly protein PilO n=1 Tax=Selenihalanaerobacter shriftii TaxID=142842 RepID=A0A1T4P4A8_9FIRM|nr:type 4a pilus biogenesis protein PilO [Selenihalanaerobacter shriftii]SJZ86086.1 type IV pilus assembly protein PilO [Selenihalanaerobacter shriftii]